MPVPVRKRAPRKTARARPAGAAKREAIRNAVYTGHNSLGGGVNQTVILRNGQTVVFKPASGEYAASLRQGILPGEQYKREKAASLIDEHLGTKLVPLTEIITYRGEVGSAQLFRAGYRTRFAAGGVHGDFADLPLETRHRMQILDDLLQHLDRHGKNWMTRGKKVALIDNGLSLSAVRQPKRFHGPFEGQPISPENLSRLDRLAATEPALRAELEPLIGPGATDLFFARALRAVGLYGDY